MLKSFRQCTLVPVYWELSGLFPTEVHSTPAMIWSDNGTKFIGSNKSSMIVLKKQARSTSPRNLRKETLGGGSIHALRNIKMTFERLVRSFKRVLYTILGTLSLTLEVLKITFCLDEHTLIIRPLTPVSAEPSHLRATTNRFLLGKQSTEIPSDVGVEEFDYRKWHARAQIYTNAYLGALP